MKPRNSVELADAASYLVALGVVLYVASLILPVTTFTIFVTTSVPGALMLILAPASLGSLPILGGNGEDDVLYFVAWLANPLLVAALYLHYRDAQSPRAAWVMLTALAAVCVAFFVLYVQPDPSGFIWPLEIGAFVWAGSLLAVFVGTSVAAATRARGDDIG